MDVSKAPSVFSYSDYRLFLGDHFQYLKATKDLSGRAFAKLVGFGSSSYLKALLERERSLRAANARKIAHRLGLARIEIDYFELLVRYDTAEGEERNRLSLK